MYSVWLWVIVQCVLFERCYFDALLSLSPISKMLTYIVLLLFSTYASRTSAYALNKKRKILDTNKSDMYTVSEDEEKPKENNGFETQWCLSEIKMRINERNLGSYVRADSLSVTHTIILIERKLFQKLKNKTEQSRKFRTKFEQINRRKMSIFFTCLRKILFCSRSRNQILENGRKFSLALFISNWKAALIKKKTGNIYTRISTTIFIIKLLVSFTIEINFLLSLFF